MQPIVLLSALRKTLSLTVLSRIAAKVDSFLSPSQISLHLWLRLYSAFVLPVLTYNMGTWRLTKTELTRLDAHHRRHVRQIIGIRWPHRISNDALYRRTQSSPISAAIRAARWSLFGHVLRLPLDAQFSSLSMPTW